MPAGADAVHEVTIPLPDATLAGELVVPAGAVGLVVFVHGSGSSRASPRNVAVARRFNRLGLATLLFDLLTADEQRVDDVTRELRFDIPLLAARLTGVLDWLAQDETRRAWRAGLFGASTGAAAALIAAAARPERVAAVVSRGGRSDLADTVAAQVRAPTLLVVGERDADVLALNRGTARRLQAPHELVVVPGATHLFPEPGTLDTVADLAGRWFLRWLR